MFSRASPTIFIFLPLAKISLPLAKIYPVAPVFVFLKHVNVFQCVNKRNIMAELSQIKELWKTELTPIHAKLVVLEEKLEQLTNSNSLRSLMRTLLASSNRRKLCRQRSTQTRLWHLRQWAKLRKWLSISKGTASRFQE